MLNLGLTLLLVMAGDPGGGATSQPSPAANSRLDPDRQICKRQLRTGTLAGYERVCRTRAEWAKLAQGTQDSWQQVQGVQGATNERMAADILTPK